MFNERQLKACVAMAGYDRFTRTIADILGYTLETTRKRVKGGVWSNEEISKIVTALDMTEQELLDTFFAKEESE